jgi:hypothetical protein
MLLMMKVMHGADEAKAMLDSAKAGVNVVDTGLGKV